MKTTKIQRLVYKMITENTGAHFLDSGGAYGRHHERNAKKTINDFIKEPEVVYQFDPNHKNIYRTVNVFHYLCGLDLDELCDKFNRRNTNCKDWDGDFYGVCKRASDWLIEHGDFEAVDDHIINTYNYDSDLSQVLQYQRLRKDGDDYFLMQIHNGCDVRGGYTDAKLFKQDYWAGYIHEYLQEYEDESQTLEDLSEGYIDSMVDYWDNTKSYTGEQVLEMLNEN